MAFRFALCNECFGKVATLKEFAETCRVTKQAGFTGFELAHFTLADKPTDLSAAQRREFAKIMREEGLEFVGLHWLMVAPAGLHVTTPDEALHRESWLHIRSLIDLCADLGPNGVMVFGSPKQRSTIGGLNAQQAVDRYIEGLSGVAEHADQSSVRILVEALPSEQCDVILTLEQAMDVVRRIDNPSVATMFDTHNATDETDPHPVVVERHFTSIHHVHVNERDGKHPGRGDYPFRSIFEVLSRLDYQGWVSVEAFDFSFGGPTIAQESFQHLVRESNGL
jgi:D-psicose/D-tagatose/L-ribulose 3-epimerase